LAILIVLLFLSAFFSSAEIAFVSLNKLRIKSMMEDKVKGAALVFKLIDEPSKMLGTVLIGNNLVNISAASLTTVLTSRLFGSRAVGIATGVLALLILVFGEITPKTITTIYAEKVAFVYAPVIFLLSRLLTPIIFILNKTSMGFLFLMRIDPMKKQNHMTENEFRAILDVSHEEGVIESEERKMITNVVDFGDSLVKDIMIPRINMTFISTDASYDELLDVFKQEQYSRFPVYEDTRDNVIGIINLKDIFLFHDDGTQFEIRTYMRSPYFTYEYKKTSELLTELRKASVSIAIVLDEYGATAGLITIEDLLEEIVGEIRDEYDVDEVDAVIRINENEYIAEGAARLAEVNEATNLKLESEEYESIAGHVINLLDRLPNEGDMVVDKNVTYTVTSVNKNRIDKVHIRVEAVRNGKDADGEE